MRRLIYHRDFPEKGITLGKDQIRRLRKLPADNPRKFPDPIRGLSREPHYDEDEIEAYVQRRMEDRGEA